MTGSVLRVIAMAVGDAPLRDVREAMHERFQAVGHSDQIDLNLTLLSSVIAAAEADADAADVIAAAVARTEQLRAEGTDVGDAWGFLSEAYQLLGDLDLAIDYAERSIDGLRAVGDTGHASSSILVRALLMLERRDAPETVLPLIDEAASHTSPHDADSVSLLAACRAILALRAHDYAGAAELADHSMRVIDGTNEVSSRADLRRWLSELPRATGDVVAERDMLLEALELYHQKGIWSFDPEIRGRLEDLDRAGA
jgi:tetratricopeptide (TPR) repeat protein